MSATDIAFPNLGIYLTNVPKSFSVFGFEIALYGVIIAIGMLCGILMAAHVSKRTSIDPDTIWDFAIYAIIFSVICARLYYVIFQWDYYKRNLLSIFNLRQGGLAIYGGVIGAFIMVFAYSKIKKISPRLLGDICVTGLILGQAIGRWGNFFNREVFGQYSNNFITMRLPVAAVRGSDISADLAAKMGNITEYVDVHPTFLYESVWNLLILFLLLLFWNRKKFDGEMILLYLGGYGLGRAIIEGIRTDQLYIPHTTIPVSQVLAIILFAFSVVTDITVRCRMRNDKAKTVQEENAMEETAKEETVQE